MLNKIVKILKNASKDDTVLVNSQGYEDHLKIWGKFQFLQGLKRGIKL